MATEMTKTAAQPSVLDLLLSGDIPNVEKELPTAAYKIDRLSDLAGHDVVFKLKALPYGKVHDIERFTQDTEVHICWLAAWTQSEGRAAAGEVRRRHAGRCGQEDAVGR